MTPLGAQKKLVVLQKLSRSSTDSSRSNDNGTREGKPGLMLIEVSFTLIFKG